MLAIITGQSQGQLSQISLLKQAAVSKTALGGRGASAPPTAHTGKSLLPLFIQFGVSFPHNPLPLFIPQSDAVSDLLRLLVLLLGGCTLSSGGPREEGTSSSSSVFFDLGENS